MTPENTASAYASSPIRRRRRTKTEMEAIRESLYAILAADHPQTVRGTFYQATVAGVVPKTDENAGYPTVQRLLVEMRRSGEIPYEWIADSTRWMRKPRTWSSIEEGLRNTANTYRRALWDSQEARVEMWVEKEALAGVLDEVTDRWDVPLMVTRGYPSMSFLHSAAVAISQREQWTYIYYLGDHDPAGTDIDRAVVKGIGESLAAIYSTRPDVDDFLRRFDGHATFERVAVTPEQIETLGLPTRPTKRNPRDHRAKRFKGDSVELDAIPAQQLRDLVEGHIERHVDQHKLKVLQVAEREERRIGLRVVEGLAS